MILEVKNISYVKFLELEIKEQEKYIYYLNYGKFDALDLFAFGDFFNKTFGFVKDFQEFINSGNLTFKNLIETCAEFTKFSEKEIAEKSIFDLHRLRIFIKDEISKINEIENNALSHYSSANEMSAGIEMFNDYKAFIQFDTLAGGDVTKFEDIRNLPYNICFTKLKLEKDRNVYEKNILRQKK